MGNWQARKGTQLVGASRSFPHCLAGDRVPVSELHQNNGTEGNFVNPFSSDIDEPES